MDKKLFAEAMIKVIAGLILVGLLIFLPAGTLGFFNGWLFMVILFVPMFVAGVIMMNKNPQLLRKRLNAKEKLGTQKGVIGLSGLMFVVGFILAGLDFRYNWTVVPMPVVWTASFIFLLGYGIYGEVLRENAYLSRTIEVTKDQRVVTTGLYAVVRHPMYFATILMFLAMPIILGSFIAFIVFLVYPLLIVIRLLQEEEVLSRELKGYAEYKSKTKYRLIPFVW